MSLPEMTLDMENPPIQTSEGMTIPATADPEPARAALSLPPMTRETPAESAGTPGRRRVTRVSAGAGDDERRPRHARGRRGQPDEDEWTEFFSKYALEWLMSGYIWLCFRGVDWARLPDDFKDTLYADEEDVATIAEALASFTHGTTFSKRYGRKVVSSAALLDAGHALFMWGIQVQKAAARVKREQGIRTPPLIQRRKKEENIERRSQAPETTSPAGEPEPVRIRIVNPGGA